MARSVGTGRRPIPTAEKNSIYRKLALERMLMSPSKDVESQPCLGNQRRATFWEEHRGAVCMSLASYSLSYMQLGTKLLGQDGMPVAQMILLRSILLLAILYGVTYYKKIPYGMLGPPNVRKLLVARAFMGNVALVLFMASVTILPLGDAVTLSFIAPILMIGLAPFLVNEAFSVLDAVTLVVGILGVLLVSRPAFLFGSTAEPMNLGHVFGFGAAAANSIGNLLVRKIGKQAHMIQIVAHFTAISVIPTILWCLLNIDDVMYPIPLPTYGRVLVMSTGALVGQALFSHSLQIEKVSKVTPMIFLQVVFAFLNDWFFFQKSPSFWTLAGASLISASVIVSNLCH